MDKKKLLILFCLTLFCAGMSISAVYSYTDTCNSEGVGKYAKKHNAKWTKKDLGWEYYDKVVKNGKHYKRYIKLYEYTCVCYNKAHTEQMKMWGSKLPYTYSTTTAGEKPKYKYVKYSFKGHTFKKGKYKITISNKQYKKLKKIDGYRISKKVGTVKKTVWVTKKMKTYETWLDSDGNLIKSQSWNPYRKFGYDAKYIKSITKYYSDGEIEYEYYKVPKKVKKPVQ